MPNSSQLASSASTWRRESASWILALTGVPSVGHVVVGGGERAVRAADLAAGEAQPVEGLRARDLVDQVEVDVDEPGRDLVRGPDLLEQRGGGHDRRSPADTMASRTASSSEWLAKWWDRSASKVTQSPAVERVLSAVDVQRQRAPLDHGGLARARLVAGRVARAAGDGARGERVARDLRAQAGQWRREHLVGVPARSAPATFTAADDGHRALLVQAQELREPQLEPRGDPAGDLQRRARLAALDLAEHGRRDAGAHREIAQREVHRLPQRLHARPDGRDGWVSGRRHYACTLSRTWIVAPTGHDGLPSVLHGSSRGSRPAYDQHAPVPSPSTEQTHDNFADAASISGADGPYPRSDD